MSPDVSEKRKVVGLGECVGFAFQRKATPKDAANFAWTLPKLLGDEGIVASPELATPHWALRQCGGSKTSPRDGIDSTGQGNTRLDPSRYEVDTAGQPRFEIQNRSHWDFLEWTPGWHALAQQADAVCFGSLAQRAPTSRATIRQFVHSHSPGRNPADFDVNLR